MSTALFVLGESGAARLTRLIPTLGAVVLPDDPENAQPEAFNIAVDSYTPPEQRNGPHP